MKTFKFIITVALCLSFFSTAYGDWTPNIWDDFVANTTASRLPDFSYAGYKCGEAYLPEPTSNVKDVTDFGAVVNDGNDDTVAIQAAITAAELSGGGVVYLPAGTYDINVDSNNPTFIEINGSNIVLRGAGSGTDGTIIHMNNMLDITVSERAAAITVGNDNTSTWGVDVATITTFTPRGSDVLAVSDSSSINEGDVYLIISTGNGTTALNEYLLYPLVPADWPQFTYANGSYTHFQWLVEVEQVIDATTIKLKQPTRADINPDWTARILRPHLLLEEVGIEDIRLTSDMPSDWFSHHADDQDFWPGIRMSHVRNGWIKNVVFADYSVDVPTLNFCKNVTVKDISVEGAMGHYGPAARWSHDCLIDGVDITAGRFHGLSTSARSQGNVFRNIALNYTKSTTGGYQAIDFHCGYAMENLFELIDGARVNSGGDLVNFPHSSRRNTFWNVRADDMKTPYSDESYFAKEFFFSFYFSNYNDYIGSRSDSHILHPESIVVGAYHDSVTLEIDQSSADRSTDWIYVEGLNQPQVSPASLYQAQFDMRVPCITVGSADFNVDCIVNLEDFAVMANQWFDCTDPLNPECGYIE